jgi:myosin heavy subunit
VVVRNVPLTQQTDYQANDPFPAESHEEALDKLTMLTQQLQDGLTRSIKLSRTNTMSSTEFTVGAADRANKILAFDSAGEIAVTQEIGTYRGNWSSGTTFRQRDLVKDTSNDNIYICVTAHTSSGSQPISSNTDVAKWALIVDAAAAASSAAAAAASAAAAALSETAAELAETNAETAETNAEAAQAAAEAAQAAAEAAQAAAETAETNAETAETNAETAQAAAEAAQLAAETAQTAAELAETNAETAETNAETAQAAAEAAQLAAETAQTAAELAETNAETAETNAAASALAASISETNAAASEAAAALSATAAASSASDAEDTKNDVLALAATVGATIADWGFINTSPTSTSDYGAL